MSVGRSFPLGAGIQIDKHEIPAFYEMLFEGSLII